MSDVQEQMRHDHAVCMLMAAYVYAEHFKGDIHLDPGLIRRRMQSVKDQSDLDMKYVSGAFAQLIQAISCIQFRTACAELEQDGPEIPLTKLTGSVVKTQTAVFREVCVEFMLEHDRGKFVVHDRGFVLMLQRIASDLGPGFDPRKIASTMIDVYLSAEHRHLQEVAEKALTAVQEKASSIEGAPHLRLAAGE